ncbi:MAG: hypothetical protein FJX75_20250 [Armatimonadetes bacterium]|nr:hypothetical protein [Armatimonadota bacterium]
MRTPLLLLLAAPCSLALSQPGEQRLYAYASVGDNQWVSDWPPIDSRETVEALFEWLDETYGVSRVYWRGEQDRMWLQHYVFRTESPLYYEFWIDWVKPLTEQVGTDDLAVAAAHRRKMGIYIFDGLFEHGAPGDIGGCAQFPYVSEDRLRVEHPEWCPVDRWDERRCPGPIEFCYPAARRALVERYVDHAVRYGYDGIAFYTYVENMGVRYVDEYGFNEPIVDEFRRRHGVDIRTEPFDREAWYRLRGEYVTQFLRELHGALGRHGKKLSMTLRCDEPNLPQCWYGTGTKIPGAGMVYLDWESWAKEGIVDELFTWTGGDPKPLLARIEEVCRDKPVERVALSSSPFDPAWKPYMDAGVTPCTVAAPGYGIDALSVQPTSADTLRSDDWRLRAQTLVDIAGGKVAVEPAAAAALAGDPHVLVRRETMRTLAALKAADQVGVLEAGLTDRESSVRIAAAKALATVNGPETPRRLLDALLDDSGFQFKQECLEAFVKLGEQAEPVLLEGLASPSRTVREVCVRALGRTHPPAAEAALLAALAGDADARVRFYAATSLGSFRSPAAIEGLLFALDDPSLTVQHGAVKMLGEIATALSAEQAAQTLDALAGLFRQHRTGCRRADAAWGWRSVGNALLGFGEAGKQRLASMREQASDGWLVWYAYEVVHVPQHAGAVATCTEDEAIATHNRYAPPFPGRRRG